MIPEIIEIIEEKSEVSFDAFFCLCTLYRRKKDYEKMQMLMESYPEFRKEPLFNHIQVQYLVHSESFYDYDELLEMAFEDALRFPDNEGCCQAFCNAFVTICESCDAEDRTIIKNKWLKKAIDSIDKAITKDPTYAKYYMTKARIMALQGMYSEADRIAKVAISKEDSSRQDYALTVGGYQSYRLSFQYDKRIGELEERVRTLEGRITQQGEDEIIEKVLPAPYIGEEPFAFISYSHKDSEEVYDVLRKMHNRGVRFWFDKGIKPGAEWPEDVAKHLSEVGTIIVMLSPASIASANVRREVNFALSEEKNIVVIQLDDVNLTPGM